METIVSTKLILWKALGIGMFVVVCNLFNTPLKIKKTITHVNHVCKVFFFLSNVFEISGKYTPNINQML